MKRFVLTGIFCFGMTSSALAAPPTPREKAGDRQALREDRRETAADRWDTARLESVLAAYRAARANGNAAQLGDLDRRFMAELAIELHESRIEVGEKGQEVRDSRGEVREERREVRKDVVDGKPVKTVRDAKDLADHKRDRNDDKRDRNVEVASLAAKRTIRDRYVTLMGRFESSATASKLGLIEEAVGLAKKEVRGDVHEQREDGREKREDRRDGRRPD